MQSIHLQQVIPTFLEKEKVASSQIWNQELVFKKGEKIQIIAPSGSGKTSLIHFLYGLRNDYTGKILYEKKAIQHFNANKYSHYRKSFLSIVLQDLRLFPEQTAEQNLTIKRILQPFHPDNKITDMAERLGIGNKLNNIAKTCSYGEQQRIAIIRSLQQPFTFLLLDEPFSHLDEDNKKTAMKLIEEEASARNAAIILADLKPIEFFNADRILYL